MVDSPTPAGCEAYPKGGNRSMATLDERWRKATRSGSNGQCVEARYLDGMVEVRNSNHRDHGTVRFTRAER